MRLPQQILWLGLGEMEPYFPFIQHFLYIKPFLPAWGRSTGTPYFFKPPSVCFCSARHYIFGGDNGSRSAWLTSLWKGPLDALTTGPHVCVAFFPTACCVMKGFSNLTSHLAFHVLIKSHTGRGLRVGIFPIPCFSECGPKMGSISTTLRSLF